MATTASIYAHTPKLFANKEVNFANIRCKLLNASATFSASHTAVNSVDGGVAPATVTITIASPGVISDTAHGFSNGQAIKIETTGTLPTGLTAGTYYFVVNKTNDNYQLAATVGGTAINTTGTQSGVHTRHAVGPYEVNGNAWPVGGPILQNVAVTQAAISDVTSNDAKLSADDIDIIANGGNIGPGYALLIYDASLMKPLGYIDFGQSQTAGDTTSYKIRWHTNGIFNWIQ